MKTFAYSKSIVAAVLLSLASTGCKDLLEEEVVSQVGADYITTPAGFEAGVRAVYSSLRDFYGRENGMNLTVFGTDTYTFGSDGTYKYMNQYTTQLDSRTQPIIDVWNAFYVGINTANAVIDQAPNVTGLDEAVKKRRVAEVKVLRAHHYFVLVQQYGDVPLVLNQSITANKEATRTPAKDVYAAIVQDLESALPDLTATTPEYGRVTKGACEHLLARVYLTKATSVAAASDDYTKAATYAQNVIKNYSYRLLPDYASVFQQGAGEINEEVIFATQYTSDPTTNGVGNETHLYYVMEYDVQAGMKRDVTIGRPFRRFRPTTYMLETVFKDRVNDSRYQKSYRTVYYCNNPGTFTNLFDTSKPSVTFKLGDTAIYLPGYEMPLAQRAKKPYQVMVPSLYRPNLFPTLTKFLDPLRPDLQYQPGSRDFLMFRLAETHLIAAEALLKSGKAADALPFINAVRRRAAFPGKETAMQITANQLTMEFIMEERERELQGEMFRWFDLKRWGLLVERVKLYNPDAAANIRAGKHELRPIPQDQIDRTAGGVAAFPQNPGY
ncbi:RagB/SusD family nutrient uptake outer membrane protein [Hymenobacter tibetensis]|uniref:RagB/SusD family nutrient uptake outer membrane protein n=1 Tax=Hymenobacter tibetensis TaxID=497967 RepID=A0ABY4D1Y4_9BACT|nr:RagB/SusD family nutrient uptake outer membrane protein [Hymenobacter tibetensis]UOG76423.1 RagB/SusD family nutrient uptake outer membrane protein [Hymenobacter tibetensis]